MTRILLIVLGFALCATAADIPLITEKLPPGVTALKAPGIHNLFGVGTNIFSGSAPEGDEAFEALAKLGVKTILTVDGARPDVEMARKHGMRYIHLPHGYDGIHTNTQAMIVKAVEGADGPVYIHCHHGKHRGPTAVAVVCMADHGWTQAQAESWMVAAGTATNYAGFCNDVVRTFHKPTAEQLGSLPSTFPDTAKSSGLTESMVEIDERWDQLKAVRAAGYKAPKDHPDINPANEAVILWEHYREAQRLPESIKHGPNLLGRLKTAEVEAKEAEQLLRSFANHPKPDMREQLDQAFDTIGKTCASCHKAYRDPSGIKSRQ